MAQDDDATASVETGRRGQRLVVEGWLASHADSGSPGPHVHLRTTDREDAVLRTDQVGELVAALRLVADRIDQLWDEHGDRYAEEVVLRQDDPQDPEVAHQRLLRRLRLVQSVADALPEVLRLLRDASSTDEALEGIGRLLDVDEAEVLVGLARFDLLALTRPATERRVAALRDG